MLKSSIVVIVFLAAAGQVLGQQKPDEPKIKVNFINACNPSAEEQAILKSALSRVSGNPIFAEDFEISRGRTAVKDEPTSKFVRLRRDFVAQAPLLTVQYSMSSDDKTVIELLVLRLRDAKEFHEVSIEDRVSADAASPVSVVSAGTPASRIRIERLGKGSVVLSRCEDADQSAYEPLFQEASALMARYKGALGLRTVFRQDIAWLAAPAKTAASPNSRKQP